MKLPSISLCLLIPLFLAGCMCQGYVSDVKSEDAAIDAKSVKTRFYVAKLNLPRERALAGSCFTVPGGKQGFSEWMDANLNEMCRVQFMRQCKERYGELFANEGEPAVALAVDLQIQEEPEPAWGALPFVLSATVFPGYKSKVYHYKLQVAAIQGPYEDAVRLKEPRSFDTEHNQYMTFYSPLGLFYWGGTEKFNNPIKRGTMLDNKGMMDTADKERLNACVDTLVQELAKNQEAFSKVALSISAPAPQAFGAGGPAPATAPPGGGIVAPPTHDQPAASGLAL